VGVSGVFCLPLTSTQEAVDIVQRAFPSLAEFPSDRIEFLAIVELAGVKNEWSKIADELWPHMHNNPPKTIMVQVVDGPDDEKRRMFSL
jgi:hypothetical protein